MSPTAAGPEKRDAAAELSLGPNHQSPQPVDVFDGPVSTSESPLRALMLCFRCHVLYFAWAGPHHAQLCQHEVNQTLRDEAEGQQAGSSAFWIPWLAHWAPWLPVLAGKQG